MLKNHNYNPDVLTCIANLSSDEVFTPPQLVNRILDLLPPEIWSDKKATFLDPGCKSGVFLREIAKRLDTGLEKANPRPAEADEPHLQEPTLRTGDHGTDRSAVTPVRLLLQDRQREVFRLRDLRQSGGQHPLQARRAYLGEWALRVLRGQRGELRARIGTRNPRLSVHSHRTVQRRYSR